MKLLKGRTPNIWDEEWELGGYNTLTGAKTTSTDRIRSKNKISILPNTDYYTFQGTGGKAVLFYDENENFVSYIGGLVNEVITTPSNARYMTFMTYANYGTSYNHDISINYPSTDHDYHPYKALIKSGGFLNKIETLPSNMKMAKGSDFNWVWSGGNIPYFATSENVAVNRNANDGYYSDVICDEYPTGTFGGRNRKPKGIFLYNKSTNPVQICIYDADYNEDSLEEFVEHIKDIQIIYIPA